MTARDLAQRLRTVLPPVLLAISALMLVGCTVGYALRAAACAAVTIFPAGCWSLAGAVLCGLGRDARRRRLTIVLAVAWLAFLLAFAEEPGSLLRALLPGDGGWEQARQDGRAIRVVTLNCARRAQAAAEVGEHQPDIVLLQESPGADELAGLARQWFGEAGGCVVGADASILARGKVVAVPTVPGSPFVQARVTLPGGQECTVISLRLHPPPVEIALWWPSTWTLYREDQEARCRQMSEVVSALGTVPPGTRVVVGGDFNSPGGDAAPAALAPRLHDAFRDGGSGWPNTIFNDYPFARIDQVWVDAGIRAARVEARCTVNSDHRMVVADLVVR